MDRSWSYAVIPICGLVVLLGIASGIKDPRIILPVMAVVIILPIAVILIMHKYDRRPRPQGYVGKFRRPDGQIAHVARMESGRLWAASDTQPPEEIGYVSGRELASWTKLADEPDG